MTFFIGIIPPDEYKKRVSAFRNDWENHYIDEIVEPHITLKSQGGLTEDLKWLNRIKRVCSETSPFCIKLDQPMFFGEEILYLSAQSDELHILHGKLVGAVTPSKELVKKYFELEDFVPHLTLGKTAYGLTKKELKEMAALAESEIGPFPVIDVSFIRIYQEVESGRYEEFKDIPLGDNF